MLKLTRTQSDVLDRQAATRFERRVVARLKAALPAAERPEVDAQAAAGIEQAAGFGITAEDEVLHFLSLRLRFGPHFVVEPWAQPLHSAEPDARIRLEASVALLARRMDRQRQA